MDETYTTGPKNVLEAYRASRTHGMGEVQFATLMSVALAGIDRPNGITPSEIADEMELTPDGVAKNLTWLRKAGFVHGDADSKDARIRRLYVTDSGYEIMAKYLAAMGHPVPPASSMRIAKISKVHVTQPNRGVPHG